MQDLELSTLFSAMAHGDKYLWEVARVAVLSGSEDLDTILYRQNILKDCLNNPSVVREIYQITIEAMDKQRRHWLSTLSVYPTGILYGANQMMQMFIPLLKRLKSIADENSGKFVSEGFIRFFDMICRELDDDYFTIVQNHLQELRFAKGVLISAELGVGNEGKSYVLRKPVIKQNRVQQLFSGKQPVYSFSIHPRDDHGARALADLRDKGLNLVANALAQSAEHIDSFFKMLRVELAFYIGCMNLYDHIAQLGETITFPQPVVPDQRRHSFQGLYDICLALTMKHKTVGNDVNADQKDILFVTGANQGGKSTFLRSIGLAQLLMQSGMFVPAESFCANISSGVFTHYKRKEDASMKSGKLDEELARMSSIVDHLTPNSLLLFNESFAATNEREGSEIARQITSALLEKRIKIVFVTHMYDFAHGFFDKQLDNAIFLRAERKAGGGRTYKLFEGEPLQTSFGEDLYHKVFQPGHSD
jgi:DNA mismatch repair ATPase MutS